MSDPLWDRICFAICRIIGHRQGSEKWVYSHQEHFVCRRCCRLVSSKGKIK